MPFLEKRPSCENASASTGFPHSKDGSAAASAVRATMNRIDIPTTGIWIFFMLLTPIMLTITISESRKIAMTFDIVSVNSNPSGS